ncbi:MAG: PDZ domain-containing protein [Prevotellaceae bacterium]|jgi:C-terminal processing protease CtpA/Prc|nr:PDZ domain-containing protein [Prevotellaceae bacterium]
MKLKTLLFLFAALALSACCKDDDTPAVNIDRTEAQQWIEEKLRAEYLWYTEIPASDKLDYTLDTEAFFNSLLSKKDGKNYTGSDGKQYHSYFSYIEKLTETEAATRGFINDKDSYGMEILGLNVSINNNGQTELYGLVCYVLPGSPAEEAGIQRGDWIVRRDNKPMSAVSEMTSGAACSFLLATAETTAQGTTFTPKETVDIAASCAVTDNPIHFYTILPTDNGKQVGYLVYNQFEAGINGSATDTSYDDQLKELSTYFTGVDEFVLDLRYNNGGLLSSAMILCNILCPQAAFGKDLGYLEYNKGSKSVIRPTKAQLEGIHNLNLPTLYVLTSEETASASEMVINSLRPYMQVVVIGERTVGKDVGSVEYTDDTQTWKMHPIVCRITNSEGKGDYSNGLTPDEEVSEVFKYNAQGYVTGLYDVLPLGDSNERVLKAALDRIGQQTRAVLPEAAEPTGDDHTLFRKAGSSLSRKATAVIIDPSFQ